MSEIDELVIHRSENGFYEGFNTTVTVTSKILVALLVIWAAVFPDDAQRVLLAIRQWSFTVFGAWYIYAMAFFLVQAGWYWGNETSIRSFIIFPGYR